MARPSDPFRALSLSKGPDICPLAAHGWRKPSQEELPSDRPAAIEVWSPWPSSKISKLDLVRRPLQRVHQLQRGQTVCERPGPFVRIPTPIAVYKEPSRLEFERARHWVWLPAQQFVVSDYCDRRIPFRLRRSPGFFVINRDVVLDRDGEPPTVLPFPLFEPDHLRGLQGAIQDDSVLCVYEDADAANVGEVVTECRVDPVLTCRQYERRE